jgi:hypothetical protein
MPLEANMINTLWNKKVAGHSALSLKNQDSRDPIVQQKRLRFAAVNDFFQILQNIR